MNMNVTPNVTAGKDRYQARTYGAGRHARIGSDFAGILRDQIPDLSGEPLEQRVVGRIRERALHGAHRLGIVAPELVGLREGGRCEKGERHEDRDEDPRVHDCDRKRARHAARERLHRRIDQVRKQNREHDDREDVRHTIDHVRDHPEQGAATEQ
jgi:hypothetical protein